MIAIFGVLISYLIFKSSHLYFIISTITVLAVAIFYYYKVSANVFELYFDSEYLLLENHSESLKIGIDKVKRIESTSHRIKILGAPFYKYRIKYINGDSIEESVKFWIGVNNTQVNAFQKVLDTYKERIT